MKLIDLNRDGGIGANSLFIQLGGLNILIDCGLHPKKAGRAATPDFRPLQGVRLDLIIITHCHLDHIGSLPVVLRTQTDAPVIMTTSSRMLIERMLHNSASVMMRQREDEGIADYPLFTRGGRPLREAPHRPALRPREAFPGREGRDRGDLPPGRPRRRRRGGGDPS